MAEKALKAALRRAEAAELRSVAVPSQAMKCDEDDEGGSAEGQSVDTLKQVCDSLRSKLGEDDPMVAQAQARLDGAKAAAAAAQTPDQRFAYVSRRLVNKRKALLDQQDTHAVAVQAAEDARVVKSGSASSPSTTAASGALRVVIGRGPPLSVRLRITRTPNLGEGSVLSSGRRGPVSSLFNRWPVARQQRLESRGPMHQQALFQGQSKLS